MLPTFTPIATYEQCPWDRDHVLALYLNLHGSVIVDGRWHRLQSRSRISRYRVVEGAYFQAIFAPRRCEVVDMLSELHPPDIEDDAEWHVGVVAGSRLCLSSCFAITPGLFDHQEDLNEWLSGFGLALCLDGGDVVGVANLPEVDTVSMYAAMRRLTWLENVLDEVNRSLDAAGGRVWNLVKRECQLYVHGDPEMLAQSGSLALPPTYFGTGAKRRESLGP